MGRFVALLAALVVFGAVGIDAKKRRLVDPVIHAGKASGPRSADDPPCKNYNCTQGWLSRIPVNHWEAEERYFFKMQYLYNLDYYDMAAKNGPLFFYTGNEGAIETFADNTGIMWDLAKQFKAAIVFAEHRFYGMTQPFRTPWTDATKSVDGVDKISTLDVREVIEDYAHEIPRLKTALKLPPSTPVIAFGGSYGGMITGWLALKYPNLLAGAWASSAPLIYFKDSGLGLGAFDAITKKTFLDAGCNEQAIVQGFNAIHQLGQSQTGWKQLEQIFNVSTDSPITSAEDAGYVEGWVREAFEYMAMTDYPYPSSFLEPMPGWPVKEACKFLSTPPLNKKDYVGMATRMANAAFVYYGKNKTHCVVEACGDEGTGGLDGGKVRDPKAYLAWPFQECTQMTIYSCSQGPPNDFFSKDCNDTNFISYSEDECKNEILNEIQGYAGNKTDFKPYFVRDEYGYNLTSLRNVIFTNGNLDPWSGGGITTAHLAADAKAYGVYVYTVEGSAHHLDLRAPNTCDPEPIKALRYQIVGILKCWLGLRPTAECSDATKLQWDLPPFSQQQTDNCATDYSGYPWGQTGNSGGGTDTTTTIAPTTTAPGAGGGAGQTTTTATPSGSNSTSGSSTASTAKPSDNTTKGAAVVALSSCVFALSVVLSLAKF
ncbi:PCP-1.1 protein [Aphelenchoides avenae]|nr:PCP-1.1 protein [Aphelenchus avenae]